MKKNLFCISFITACMVSCSSLPSNIDQGISKGDPHAYYEAGKYIDSSQTLSDCPVCWHILCFPLNVCILTLTSSNDTIVERWFYYEDVESRNKKAAEYYLKGTKLGDADCLYEMGRLHENGQGAAFSISKAEIYYAAAAKRGSAEAARALKDLHESPSNIIGKRLILNTGSGNDILRVDVKGGICRTDDGNMVCISYKKTGATTGELEIKDPNSSNETKHYNLRFKNNHQSDITKGWTSSSSLGKGTAATPIQVNNGFCTFF